MDRVGRSGRRWILAIVLGLGIVVTFNAFYIYVAVSDADPVARSYVVEPR